MERAQFRCRGSRHESAVAQLSTLGQRNHRKYMDPSNIIVWAVCLGVAWLVFASNTGADDWLKSVFGKSKPHDLEDRVEKLEKRMDEISKK